MRLNAITTTISSHLCSLHSHNQEDGNSNDNPYKDKDPHEQLMKLLEEQNKLLGLRGKTKRLRMDGITQSYNMMDSIAF